MLKRGISVILISLILPLLILTLVSAQNETENDVNTDVKIPQDLEDSCEGVVCEDGFVCGNGKCISTIIGGPYIPTIDEEGLEQCRNDCKIKFENEDERSKCIGGCKDDSSFNEEDYAEGGNNVKLCHIPEGNKDNAKTIKIAESAVDAHLKHGDYFGECEEINDINVDEVLGNGGVNSGIGGTIDRFFDSVFKSDLGNMKERFAEIRTLINENRIEEAKELLKYYTEFADKLEKEVSPEEKEEAVKLSKIIRKAIEEMENGISEEDSMEFKKEIQKRANKVGVAAEIASKINGLCKELAELDPDLFYDNCKTGDEGPKWHKDMFDDLTGEQKKEAEKFAKIMGQCFKSSGVECKCEEIPYEKFANACLTAAPLATACDLGGDEKACMELDNLDMPELPPHLESIMMQLEGQMIEDKFELHMPLECREAGAKTPKECSKIMIEIGAPDECKEALLSSGCDKEFECRKICDKIMFDLHAPPECKDKGISDPRECAKLMDSFKGENMRSREKGPMIDFNCKSISDPTARLECYDKASSQAKSYKGFDDSDYEGPCMTDADWKAKKAECRALYGEHAGDEPIKGDSGQGYECVIDAKCIDFGEGKESFEDIKKRENVCANDCSSKGGAWDFTGGICQCKVGDYGNNNKGPVCDDCASKCESRPGQRLRRTDCGPSGCECYYEPDDKEIYPETPTCANIYCGETSHCENGACIPNEYAPGEGPAKPTTEPTTTEPTTTEPTTTEPTTTEPTTTEPVTTEPVTTEPVITGNAFLDYYFN